MKQNEEKYSSGWILFVFILLIPFLILAEDVSYFRLLWIHIALCLGAYLFSQKTIDNNLFLKLGAISVTYMMIDIVKWFFLSPDVSASLISNVCVIYLSALPLLYILYFRLLTRYYYPNYPLIHKKPTIILYGRNASMWRGKKEGYIPTPDEKSFSVVLGIGLSVIVFSVPFIFMIAEKLVVLG